MKAIILLGLVLVVLIDTTLGLCPAGRHATDTGVCMDCVGGKYRKDGDDSACHFCPPSHYSKSEASECIECPANTGFNIFTGDIDSNSNSSLQDKVVRIDVQQTTRSEACEPCRGKFTRAKGLSFCNNCPPGTYVADCEMVNDTPPGPTASPTRSGDTSYGYGYYDEEAEEAAIVEEKESESRMDNRHSDPTSPSPTKVPEVGPSYICYCKQCEAATYSDNYGGAQCSYCPLGKMVKSVNVTHLYSLTGNMLGELKGVPHRAIFKTWAKESDYKIMTAQNSWIYQGELPDDANTEKHVMITPASGDRYYSNYRPAVYKTEAAVYYDSDGNEISGFGVPFGGKVRNFAYGTASYPLLNTGCEDCPMGTYGGKQDSCIACPAGKFSDSLGLLECLVCPRGKFQSRTGMHFCSHCPQGKDSNAGSSQCLLGKNGDHKEESAPDPAPTPSAPSAREPIHAPIGEPSPTPRPSAFFSHDVVHEVTHEVVVEQTNTTLVWTVVLLNVLVCVLIAILYRTCVRKHVGGVGEGTGMYSSVSGDVQLEDVSITPLRAGSREDVPPLPL